MQFPAIVQPFLRLDNCCSYIELIVGSQCQPRGCLGAGHLAGSWRGRRRMVTTCSHVGVAAFDDRLFSLAKRRLCPFSLHAPEQKQQKSWGKWRRRGKRKRKRKHVAYKLWTSIIAYFPCLWCMQHDSDSSAGHQSTDWCGRITITRNIHILIHIPIRNRIRVANLLCLCRMCCKSDSLGKKAEKSLHVCAWVCVLYAYECVCNSLSFFYSPTLSLSLSITVKRLSTHPGEIA